MARKDVFLQLRAVRLCLGISGVASVSLMQIVKHKLKITYVFEKVEEDIYLFVFVIGKARAVGKGFKSERLNAVLVISLRAQ